MVRFLTENLQCVRKGLLQRVKPYRQWTMHTLYYCTCTGIKLNFQALRRSAMCFTYESEINTGWHRGAGNTPNKIKIPYDVSIIRRMAWPCTTVGLDFTLKKPDFYLTP